MEHTAITGPHDDLCVSTQQAFTRGACVCCSAPLEPFDEWPVTAIGEGVLICGYCAYRGHTDDDVAPVLLAMLVCKG